jgi:prepilin-type N-terminal cleavage/methylation domain-containing protein
MTGSRTSERGFTMIEVMVSLLLTAIAVIGIIALFMTETRASSVSRHATEASVLAADKLEKLRTTPNPTGSNDTVDALGDSSGTFLFTRTWTVTPGPVGTEYNDLMVTVTWSEDGYTTQPSVVVYGRQNL